MYNYQEALKEDIRNYIIENTDYEGHTDRDEFEEQPVLQLFLLGSSSASSFSASTSSPVFLFTSSLSLWFSSSSARHLSPVL